MTWIPVSTQLPPNGEVVETRDDDYSHLDVYLLYYDAKFKYWVGGRPKNFTPTHWRKKEGK